MIWIEIALKFIQKCQINDISLLFEIMAWHWSGDKPLSQVMTFILVMHICAIRPQWVNSNSTNLEKGLPNPTKKCWTHVSWSKVLIHEHFDCIISSTRLVTNKFDFKYWDYLLIFIWYICVWIIVPLYGFGNCGSLLIHDFGCRRCRAWWCHRWHIKWEFS